MNHLPANSKFSRFTPLGKPLQIEIVKYTCFLDLAEHKKCNESNMKKPALRTPLDLVKAERENKAAARSFQDRASFEGDLKNESSPKNVKAE